jgi:4-phytase/acid phosphatase
MSRVKCKVLYSVLLALAVAAPVPAQTITNDDTILRQIIVFGRHGVRSTTVSPAAFAQYSPRPYAAFTPATPGYLTVHGQQAEILLGTYFRDYLIAEGLLTGNNSTDLPLSYFRANSIQRSNLTATKLGAGLFVGATVPVHSFALGTPDPMFDPILANVSVVDPVRAANEVQEIYNSGATLASAYSGEFSLIRSVLYNYQNGTQPPPATPSGFTDPTAQAIPLTNSAGTLYTGGVIDEGGLSATVNASDPFVMEYAAGLPSSEVAWGQLSADALSQTTRAIVLEQNIAMRTPYLAQVQSSNAASHMLHTMKQAVLGESVAGAFSQPAAKVVVVISSDAYVTGLAGLLNLHWQLSGYQPDFCAPGGALVFEVRQSRDSGEYLVRVFYTAQSFDQLRNLTPLSLQAPPETAQIFIPGGSQPGVTLDVKFETFQALVTNAIGPQYVESPWVEEAPGVLASVPAE